MDKKEDSIDIEFPEDEKRIKIWLKILLLRTEVIGAMMKAKRELLP